MRVYCKDGTPPYYCPSTVHKGQMIRNGAGTQKEAGLRKGLKGSPASVQWEGLGWEPFTPFKASNFDNDFARKKDKVPALKN